MSPRILCLMLGLFGAPTLIGLVHAASSTYAGPPRDDKTVKQGPLPAGALVRLVVPNGHQANTRGAVTFSADGKRLASAGGDQFIRVWDTNSSTTLSQSGRTSGTGATTALAFSADGKFLFAGDWYGTLYRWESGQLPEGPFFEAPGGINAVAISPDGKTLVLATDKHDLHAVDANTGKELRLLKGHDAYVSAVTFAKNGKTLITGSQDRTIRLWDLAGGKVLATFRGHEDHVSAVAISPDGKTLASGSWDGSVRLWQAKPGGKELRRWSEHLLDVTGVAFSPDGQTLASVGLDGTLRLWDVSSGKRQQQISVHHAGVLAVAYSRDGKSVATCSASGAVKLWDPASGKEIRQLVGEPKIGQDQEPSVWSVAFSPDGTKLVTGHGDKTVRQWDAASGKHLRILGQHPQTVWGVAYSPDGKTVASCARRQGVVRLWDADTGQLRRICHGPRGGISRLAFSQVGKFLAGAGGSFDPTIFLWDPATGKELQRFSGHEDYVDAIGLTPDAKFLVSASRDGLIRVWQVATGKELKRIAEHPDGEIAVSVSPDGKSFAAGGGEQPVRLFDLMTGRPLPQVSQPDPGVKALAFSLDGKTLAIATYNNRIANRIALVERATGKVRLRLEHTQGVIYSLAFSPDGRRLATAGADGTVLVWDVTGLVHTGRKLPFQLSADELNKHWTHLAHDDAALAGQALWTMVACPEQSVARFGKHLQPVPAVDPKRIDPLLDKLDANEFAVRDKAMRELEEMGDQAESALRKALENGPSLEVKRRIDALLAKLGGFEGERLRTWRALEALENIATPEARTVLETMARGAPGAWLTQEAQAILDRLQRRR